MFLIFFVLWKTLDLMVLKIIWNTLFSNSKQQFLMMNLIFWWMFRLENYAFTECDCVGMPRVWKIISFFFWTGSYRDTLLSYHCTILNGNCHICHSRSTPPFKSVLFRLQQRMCMILGVANGSIHFTLTPSIKLHLMKFFRGANFHEVFTFSTKL